MHISLQDLIIYTKFNIKLRREKVKYLFLNLMQVTKFKSLKLSYLSLKRYISIICGFLPRGIWATSSRCRMTALTELPTSGHTDSQNQLLFSFLEYKV